MISESITKAMNEQINAEMYSSYLYLAMAAYFDDLGLAGMSNWMKVQAQEELVHSMKFFDFIAERDGRVVLDSIQKPQKEWDSPLAAFEAAYGHEQYISGRINDLVSLAEKENDRASMAFLQWFVTEQVEEEASAKANVDNLKLMEGAPQALFLIDREMRGRAFAAPAAAADA